MLTLLASPSAFTINGYVDEVLVRTFCELAKAHKVGIISNKPKPAWFDGFFDGKKVAFIERLGRQNGIVIKEISEKLTINKENIIVLAVTPVDVQMAKNGGAVLVGAGWATDGQIKRLGLKVDSGAELKNIFSLTDGWDGNWWFKSDNDLYSVRALADMSSYGASLPESQKQFGAQLVNTVKVGGYKLPALLAVAARSLLTDGIGERNGLFWCVYPSSKNINRSDEVLSDFSHRLRTTVSRCHHAKVGEPMFIRHAVAPKRSFGQGGDREDPQHQITTIHLNPFYKNSIVGKSVIVIDDCTTYGVSFAVAAALLKKAGAASVTGVALGKLGDRALYFEMTILTDPFKPVLPDGYFVAKKQPMLGVTNGTAQQLIRNLL